MKIQILFFAQLRETAGYEQAELEMREGMTVGCVARDIFSASLKEFYGLPVRFAVNENFVAEETILHNGDRLAFIPPVAGG